MLNAAFDVEPVMSGQVSGGVWTVQGAIKLVLLLFSTHFVAGHGKCRENPGRDKCPETKSMHCEAGQRPQIVEAYYLNNSAKCGINCEPRQKAEPHQCLKDLPGNKLYCVQRLSLADLGVVYWSCKSPRYCPFDRVDKGMMSMPGEFLVQHYCIAESSTMDPCQFCGSRRTNASFLLPLNSPGCHRHCDVTPVNTNRTLSFNYRFIQGFDNKSRSVSDNELLYRFIYEKSDENVTWKKLNSSYYTDFRRFRSLTKLEIRFGIRQPEIIRHLWVSFKDEEVEVFCEETICKKEEPDTDLDERDDSSYILIIGLVIGMLAAGSVAVLVFCVWRNREVRCANQAPRRRRSRGSNNDLSPSPPSASGNARISSFRVCDEIREDTQDDGIDEGLSLTMAPTLPGQASQSHYSERAHDHRQPSASQSAFRDNKGDRTIDSSGYVFMGGTSGRLGTNTDVKHMSINPAVLATQGTNAPHNYANDSIADSSAVDADRYLAARPLIRGTDKNRHSDASFEYIELWPDRPSTE